MRFLRSPLFWIGLLISLGALFFAFRGLTGGREALRGVNYLLLCRRP
jgi:hypothetical protein